MIKAIDLDMEKIRKSVVKNAIQNNNATSVSKEDIKFLMDETGMDESFVLETLKELEVKF